MERGESERNKKRKMNSLSIQTIKMKLSLFFTHFLSLSFLYIHFPSYHFFQLNMSLVEMSGKGREGEKIRINLSFIIWFDMESSLILFISFPFPLLSFPSIFSNQTRRKCILNEENIFINSNNCLRVLFIY